MTSRVAVVGAGNWGKNLVRNFHALDALGAVVEVSPELRQRVTADYPEVPVFDRLETVLASDIPAVVIATPAPTHYDLALQALKAGKDVFIEKPMTLEMETARSLATYADQHDRILMVGHLLLYQPAIAWMRDYLATGKAGTVRHVSTQRLKLGRVRAHENVWWSFAPHDISVVLDLLGSPEVQDIQAQGQAMIQPTVEDYVHVDLTFANGTSAHIHCSWYWPTVERRTVVIAERQILVYDEIAQTVTIHQQHIEDNLQHVDAGKEAIDVAAAEPLKLECQHFLDCIAQRQTPRSDGWNGVAVVNILEQAQGLLNG